MSPPPASVLSTLPALSVVLGLPLCHINQSSIADGATKEDGSGGERSNNQIRPAVANGASSPSTSTSRQTNQDDFANRAKNNVSRIYARRVIDRARLEREHPWRTSSSSADAVDASIGARGKKRGQPINSDEGDNRRSSLKDDLLSETLVSLIQLQEKMNKVKSFTSCSMEGNDTLFISNNSNNNNLLSQLGLENAASNNPFPSANQRMIASCESINYNEQRTVLNHYNDLQNGNGTKTNNASPDDGSKPAEWGDGIDLVQRRAEFGKEISPLSGTTRLQRWTMACKRVVTLGMLAAPLGVMVPANVMLGNFVGKKKPDGEKEGGKGTKILSEEEQQQQLSMLQRYHRHLTQSTWDYALWAVETAGPTYIKLVQWASTRNDIFSPEFVGHFSKLQDETRGHTWKETEATLVRAFGKDWRSILSFDKLIEDEDDATDGVEGGRLKRKGGLANRERQKRLLAVNEEAKSKNSSSTGPTIPIGSGCVAQVYKARLCTSHGLHPAGTSVAVKVQHPNILEKVCLDFYIVNKLASFLECIPGLNLDYLSVKDSVDQFRDIMLPQLDLRVEAHNLQRFRRDFEGESQIAFPEPLVSLTSREVLVERFVEGEPMLNFVLKEDEHHSRKDREDLATIGLETVMKMIFLHDFIHADLHPGNMIVDRNKSVRGNPIRVNMIDCGLTVELGEQDHMNLVKILGSLIKKDGYSAGGLMVDTAKKCQATELDVEMFCRGMEKICIDDEENNFLESVGDYITDICYLACKHKVKLEAAFINAALACEIMEGLASSLYPEMAVQSVALPMVLKAEMMHGLKGLPGKRFWGSK